ncbi:MAG: sigma-70 family RNA polymerase sigma factor [Phycisphaerae bacterium]|nr:sigma-70 family RNA polymerase sigma factor [Phycisphaerae bacterium]
MSAATREVKLLMRCLQGDTEAYAPIVSRYQDLVCGIIFSATANVEVSEELAHQTFVNAWKNLSQLNDLRRFRPWLCVIARNNVRNFLRKKRRDVISQAEPMENLNGLPSVEVGPLDSAIRREREALVCDAIRHFPKRYREAMVLFYRQNQSVKAVAESLDLTENAVKQRLLRGRNMIKKELEDLVEQTLSSTGPKKAFTTAVIASVAGLAVEGATAIVGGAAAGGGSTAAGLMSGLAVKITAAVLAVALGAGAFAAYRLFRKGVDRQKEVASYQQPVAPEEGDIVEEAFSEVVAGDRQTLRTQVISPAAERQMPLEPTQAVDSDAASASANATAGVSARPEEVLVQAPKTKPMLSGIITDAQSGEPVTDAMVRLRASIVVSSMTDANGYYHFDEVDVEGQCRMWVFSKAYVGIYDEQEPLQVTFKKDEPTVRDLVLERACMVDVFTLDEMGAPVSRATVYATTLADTIHRRQIEDGPSRSTDPNGYVLVGGFRPSETPYLITVTKPGYAPAKLIFTLTDPEVVEYGEVVLQKGIEVSGHARYADGLPAVGAKISARPKWWPQQYWMPIYAVEPNGFFTLQNVAPGDYTIFAHLTDQSGGGATSFGLMESTLPPADGGLLYVEIPRKSPQSLASISGTVLYAEGRRPDRLCISALSPMGTSKNTEIRDNLERFNIGSLEPGNYRLHFSGPNLEEKIIENVPAPTEGLIVELAYVERPQLRGKVTDGRTGDVIAKYKVRVGKIRTLSGLNYAPNDYWYEIDDEDGKFSVESVGPGIYQVQVAAPGYAWAWSNEINTDTNGEVKVLLWPGGSISGRVVNEDGEPVSGAKVIPLSKACGNMVGTNDRFVSDRGAVESYEGKFTLAHLAAGTEMLKIVHPDYLFRILPGIKVVEGQNTEIKVVLGKGATLEGIVYDAMGNPEPGVALFFQDSVGGSSSDEAGRLATTVTDSNGYYCVMHLPQQPCWVSRQNSSVTSGVSRMAILPQKGRSLWLDFGRGPKVSGRLVVNGNVVPDRRVVLTLPSNAALGWFRCNGVTGPQGEFQLAGAPPGRYAVYYKQEGQRSQWIKAADVEIGRTDIDLGTVPEATPDVRITIEESSEELVITDVSAWQGTTKLRPGQRIGIAKAPEAEGGPYVFSNLPTGRHTLSVRRGDGLYFYCQIEIVPGIQPLDIYLDTQGTSSIQGRVSGDVERIALWNSDQTLKGSVRIGQRWHV